MSIHEHLPPQAQEGAEGSGLDERAELAKVARGTVSTSIVQPGCTKPARCRRSSFKREVEKELTGKEDGAVGD